MSTVGAVIDRTVRQLLSGTVEERNKLASTVTATATSIPLSYDVGGVRKGAIIEVEAEQMYVWDVTVASKTATVERGFNGTTAASHAGGKLVTVNPRFPRANVLSALNQELDDLSSPMHGLFQIKTIDIDYNGSDVMMNLPTMQAALDLLSVSVRNISTEYPIVRKVHLVRDLPTDDFSSGFALRFDQGVRPGRVHIVYKAAFTNVTAETQNLQNISGLPTTCEDIVEMGVQIRLMSAREIKRNFTESQGDTRRADEVGAGAVANSITGLLRLRRDRIIAEAAKLMRQYPTFMSKV